MSVEIVREENTIVKNENNTDEKLIKIWLYGMNTAIRIGFVKLNV